MADLLQLSNYFSIFAATKPMRYMTASEMKYALFKEIESIDDEALLRKIITLVKSITQAQPNEAPSEDDLKDIPDFVRNMSVKTDIPGTLDAKELMHEHWVERYE